MNKIDIDKNIIYIEDFIPKEDLSIILDAVNNNSFVEDHEHPVHLSLKIDSDKNVIDIWFKYIKNLRDMLERPDRKIILPAPTEIVFTKYRNFSLDGSDNSENEYFMLPHCDDASIDWEDDKKGATFVSHGIVIFITDDFDGGEIVYVNKDISIKPKAGSLLVHPGNLEYSHAVNKFSNGERIVFAAFVHEDRK